MPFALSCRTLRKFFGDVVFFCVLVKSAVKCAVPRIVVVLCCDLGAFYAVTYNRCMMFSDRFETNLTHLCSLGLGVCCPHAWALSLKSLQQTKTMMSQNMTSNQHIYYKNCNITI